MHRRFDVPVVLATALLVLVLAWRVVLALAGPEPPRARDLLPLSAGTDMERPRRLLVTPATHAAGDSTVRATAGIRRLLRSFGYETLPVAITLDADGHVVLIQPVPPAVIGIRPLPHATPPES